jgi:hypothetical protein
MYAPQVAANLRAGILLPAWAADLNGGYGGPGLLFYPPLVSYVHALPSLLGFPAIVSIGVLAVLAHFLSGLAAWGWLRAERRPGALAAAVVYMVAPYRILDVYERAALSEHWAFLFPPLILWSLAAEGQTTGRRTALVAMGIAGLLLTNFPMAALFAPLLAAAAAAPPGPGRRRLTALPGAALGFGLSLFALVPAAFSSRWVATELFYGASAGSFAPSSNTLFGTPSLNPGFHGHVSAVALVTFLLLAGAFLLAPGGKWSFFWAAAGAVSFACMLGPVGPLWDALPVLSRLQFPWRLTAVTTLALAAVVAEIPRAYVRISLAALSALAAFVIPERMTSRAADVPRERPPAAAPATAFPAPGAVFESAGLSANPWLRNPRLADTWYRPRTLGAPLGREIFEDAPPVLPALVNAPLAALDGASPRVEVVAWGRLAWSLRVAAGEKTRVALRSLYFPGMAVQMDGTNISTSVDRGTGLLTATVPAGEHTLSWSWQPFPPLVAARRASLACLVVVLIAAVGPGFRSRPREDPRS